MPTRPEFVTVRLLSRVTEEFVSIRTPSSAMPVMIRSLAEKFVLFCTNRPRPAPVSVRLSMVTKLAFSSWIRLTALPGIAGVSVAADPLVGPCTMNPWSSPSP